MKTYPQEISAFKAMNIKIDESKLPSREQLNGWIESIRSFQKKNKTIHFLLELIPYVVLLGSLLLTLFAIKTSNLSLTSKTIILGIVHGIIGYQFVVYSMHEGAGHGLFKRNRFLNKLAFHSCRVFFADPEFYKSRHGDHHRYLGKDNDGAFVNYVLPKRILISMLPGSGVIIPNDFKIYQGDEWTKSKIVSHIIGGLFLAAEVIYLSPEMPFWLSLISLVSIGPWIGMVLDRSREIMEHYKCPDSKLWGSKELGLGPFALLVGGGPWGQPCHLSHHLAPDLNWYQQIWLHRVLTKNLSNEQKGILGYDENSILYFFKVSRFYILGGAK